MDFKEHDVILLKDGREGTILYLYDDGETVMLEIADEKGKTKDTIFIGVAEIEDIVYSA